ncbi:substrate-binding domain-containing protein [Stutzerimonas sp. R40042]|uniref:substrate-binding domain-containing protein n=1 Tax=Stutzerimonas sp. R40042 TaxID=2998559 RepID=UPI0022799622|nr:substrate-binding domain-containing protein [Stutzerimonas sp. R40042]WAE60085.1 substrate-binding domain-containing protein [Stutzerimonas sp. R40042]
MTPRVFGRFWNRALPLLLLTLGSASGNSLAAPPTPPDGSAVLRIHGSNTVGAKLAPMLVAGLFEAKGLQSVRIAPAGKENEQRVTALDERGKTIQALVAAHGTGTGFAGLKDGAADLAAASRPIKQSEAQSLAALGDMRSAESEQVIAIDGLAVIVHPDNPVQSLSVEQVARLFSGEIANWRELGGANAAVELHARDDQSGTYDTFKELVLGSQGKTLATNATRYESNDALSLAVSRRNGAIGFVGLASVGKSKALAITDGDSQPMPPTTALVATEDYPLSRRLFLYADPQKQSKWTREFLTFVHSPAGQAIVEKSGYVAQAIAPIRLPAQAAMPAAYQQLAREAQRLTVNFRFAEGSAQLDNKAQRDVQRLIDYLNSHDKQMNAAVLVGFGDARNDPARTALLSKLRAMAVRRELARGGILVKEINGLGDQLPVASNSEAGRIKNRRVEVWVY